MATTEMVHVRIDKQTKARAAKALAAMGLPCPTQSVFLLTRVAAEKALPFEVKGSECHDSCRDRRSRRWWIAPQCLRLDGRLECGGLSGPMPFCVTSGAKNAGTIAAISKREHNHTSRFSPA
jgi:DNA-damage-inducible protein J